MTTVVRWNRGRLAPLREVAVMQNELSRLMNGLFEGSWRASQSWVPTLDAWESDDALVYSFDLPGLPQEAISVEVEDGVLTVSAERERSSETSSERYHRVERRFGRFSRSVALPAGVNEEAIAASYADGVLEVRVPRPEQLKPRKIEVAVAATPIEAPKAS